MRKLTRLSFPIPALFALALAGSAWADELTDAAKNDLVLTTLAEGISGLTSFAFLPDGRLVATSRASGELLLISADGQTQTVAGQFQVGTEFGERGLLNVQPHPDFAQNPLLFVYYSKPGRGNKVVTVPLGTDDKLGPETLIFDDVNTSNLNHDGGGLAFSKDKKYLFIGSGDTGCNASPPTNLFSTCLNVPNGKILRVNLDGSIPGDNPLVSETAVTASDSTSACSSGDPSSIASAPTAPPRTEIWAWGFRNPWRISVDPLTGYLWVGDVGEVTEEEVTLVKGPKEHHGYPFIEGMTDHYGERCTEVKPSVTCTPALYSHPRGSAGSITGGVVIGDCSWPATFNESYYFGDYEQGFISALKLNTAHDGVSGAAVKVVTTPSKGGPVHFEVGPDKALYYATYSASNGRINKIAPKAPGCGGGGAGGAAGAGTGGGGSGGSGAAGGGGSSGTGASGGVGTGGSGASGGTGTGGTGAGGSGASGGAGAMGGGSGSGASGGAGVGGGAGTAGDPAVPGTAESNCGCRVPGSGPERACAALAAAGLALLWAQRRRRR